MTTRYGNNPNRLPTSSPPSSGPGSGGTGGGTNNNEDSGDEGGGDGPPASPSNIPPDFRDTTEYDTINTDIANLESRVGNRADQGGGDFNVSQLSTESLFALTQRTYRETPAIKRQLSDSDYPAQVRRVRLDSAVLQTPSRDTYANIRDGDLITKKEMEYLNPFSSSGTYATLRDEDVSMTSTTGILDTSKHIQTPTLTDYGSLPSWFSNRTLAPKGYVDHKHREALAAIRMGGGGGDGGGTQDDGDLVRDELLTGDNDPGAQNVSGVVGTGDYYNQGAMDNLEVWDRSVALVAYTSDTYWHTSAAQLYIRMTRNRLGIEPYDVQAVVPSMGRVNTVTDPRHSPSDQPSTVDRTSISILRKRPRTDAASHYLIYFRMRVSAAANSLGANYPMTRFALIQLCTGDTIDSGSVASLLDIGRVTAPGVVNSDTFMMTRYGSDTDASSSQSYDGFFTGFYTRKYFRGSETSTVTTTINAYFNTTSFPSRSLETTYTRSLRVRLGLIKNGVQVATATNIWNNVRVFNAADVTLPSNVFAFTDHTDSNVTPTLILRATRPLDDPNVRLSITADNSSAVFKHYELLEVSFYGNNFSIMSRSHTTNIGRISPTMRDSAHFVMRDQYYACCLRYNTTTRTAAFYWRKTGAGPGSSSWMYVSVSTDIPFSIAPKSFRFLPDSTNRGVSLDNFVVLEAASIDKFRSEYYNFITGNLNDRRYNTIGPEPPPIQFSPQALENLGHINHLEDRVETLEDVVGPPTTTAINIENVDPLTTTIRSTLATHSDYLQTLYDDGAPRETPRITVTELKKTETIADGQLDTEQDKVLNIRELKRVCPFATSSNYDVTAYKSTTLDLRRSIRTDQFSTLNDASLVTKSYVDSVTGSSNIMTLNNVPLDAFVATHDSRTFHKSIEDLISDEREYLYETGPAVSHLATINDSSNEIHLKYAPVNSVVFMWMAFVQHQSGSFFDSGTMDRNDYTGEDVFMLAFDFTSTSISGTRGTYTVWAFRIESGTRAWHEHTLNVTFSSSLTNWPANQVYFIPMNNFRIDSALIVKDFRTLTYRLLNKFSIPRIKRFITDDPNRSYANSLKTISIPDRFPSLVPESFDTPYYNLQISGHTHTVLTNLEVNRDTFGLEPYHITELPVPNPEGFQLPLVLLMILNPSVLSLGDLTMINYTNFMNRELQPDGTYRHYDDHLYFELRGLETIFRQRINHPIALLNDNRDWLPNICKTHPQLPCSSNVGFTDQVTIFFPKMAADHHMVTILFDYYPLSTPPSGSVFTNIVSSISPLNMTGHSNQLLLGMNREAFTHHVTEEAGTFSGTFPRLIVYQGPPPTEDERVTLSIASLPWLTDLYTTGQAPGDVIHLTFVILRTFPTEHGTSVTRSQIVTSKTVLDGGLLFATTWNSDLFEFSNSRNPNQIVISRRNAVPSREEPIHITVLLTGSSAVTGIHHFVGTTILTPRIDFPHVPMPEFNTKWSVCMQLYKNDNRLKYFLSIATETGIHINHESSFGPSVGYLTNYYPNIVLGDASGDNIVSNILVYSHHIDVVRSAFPDDVILTNNHRLATSMYNQEFMTSTVRNVFTKTTLDPPMVTDDIENMEDPSEMRFTHPDFHIPRSLSSVPIARLLTEYRLQFTLRLEYEKMDGDRSFILYPVQFAIPNYRELEDPIYYNWSNIYTVGSFNFINDSGTVNTNQPYPNILSHCNGWDKIANNVRIRSSSKARSRWSPLFTGLRAQIMPSIFVDDRSYTPRSDILALNDGTEDHTYKIFDVRLENMPQINSWGAWQMMPASNRYSSSIRREDVRGNGIGTSIGQDNLVFARADYPHTGQTLPAVRSDTQVRYRNKSSQIPPFVLWWQSYGVTTQGLDNIFFHHYWSQSDQRYENNSWSDIRTYHDTLNVETASSAYDKVSVPLTGTIVFSRPVFHPSFEPLHSRAYRVNTDLRKV